MDARVRLEWEECPLILFACVVRDRKGCFTLKFVEGKEAGDFPIQ